MTMRGCSQHRYLRQRRTRCRSAAVLVAALVCLLVVTAMIGAMLQRALAARRQLRAERDRRQTELVLQAGADRAALKIGRQADYRGEIWTPPAAAMAGRGQVTVEVRPDSEATSWQVHIVAEYPLGSQRSIRRSRTFVISAPVSTARGGGQVLTYNLLLPCCRGNAGAMAQTSLRIIAHAQISYKSRPDP